MAQIRKIKINNSAKAAVRGKNWVNPGASLYDALMDAYYYEGRIPEDERALDKAIKEGKYLQWYDFLREAYLVAPIKDIKNSPYGRTPFSRSGCKYPHHVIKNGELVLHEAGVRAAYSRAAQMGDIKGDVKDHLKKHLDELGIKYAEKGGRVYFGEEVDIMERIESNFDEISLYLMEKTGIDLFDESAEYLPDTDENIEELSEWIERFATDDTFQEAVMVEGSHGKLKYDFRLGWDYDTGHQLKIVYSLDGIDITGVGDFYWKYSDNNRRNDRSLKLDENQYKDYVKNNISKRGNTDHQSKDQKVVAIMDMATGERIKSAKVISPYCDHIDGKRIVQSKDNMSKIRQDIALNPNMLHTVIVGEIDNSSTFKSTHWFRGSTIDADTGEDIRWRKQIKSQYTNRGRGAKLDDIMTREFKVGGANLDRLMTKNPSRKEALQELEDRERILSRWINVVADTLNTGNYPERMDKNSVEKFQAALKRELAAVQMDYDKISKAIPYDPSMMKAYREYSDNELFPDSLEDVQLEWPVLVERFAVDDKLFVSDFVCEGCGEIIGMLPISGGVPKSEYGSIVKQFPNWDGRHGHLGYVMCPKCNHKQYVISTNESIITPEFLSELSKDIDIAAIVKRNDELAEKNLDWINQYLNEEGEISDPPEIDTFTNNSDDQTDASMPKKTDADELNKNGVNRKKLYIAFIEWCKEYNNKNVFGSIFDKDAFKVTYPFVPEEMRYFYRLANPILCVLADELTFFQVSELKKLNTGNPKMNELLIFAATPNDLRVFNTSDKKVYRGTEENGDLKLNEVLANSFDLYIQNMINKGDILNESFVIL